MKPNLLSAGIFIFAVAWAQAGSPIILPPSGMPMAHADGHMSDQDPLTVPGPSTHIVWQDNAPVGALSGLGAVSNGRNLVVCTYTGVRDNLVAYDYNGKRLWTSGTKLNYSLFSSAPIIDASGDVIACDNASIIRFDNQGNVRWQSPLSHGGTPISPVPLANGTIVVATQGGPIYVFDAQNGTALGNLLLQDSPTDAGFFDTLNTPAVSGNRIYVASQYQVSGAAVDYRGRLYAIDVDPTRPQQSLSVAWHYDFGGPTGGSPTLIGNTICFDGLHGFSTDINSPTDPHIFAVTDQGTSPSALWNVRVEGPIKASLGLDPRGGLWYSPSFSHFLIERSTQNGAALATMDTSALINDGRVYSPASSISVATGGTNPVAILDITSFPAINPTAPLNFTGSSYVVALDLVQRTLLWKVKISNDANYRTLGQFPILMENGKSRVVFSQRLNSAIGLGD